MPITVFMRSDVFGCEEFEYDTPELALAGIERLRADVQKQNDGIPREIGLKVNTPVERLEYLRGEIEKEQISYEGIAELQSLSEHIEVDDVQLLEWAGVSEQEATENQFRQSSEYKRFVEDTFGEE